jgi:hypothetical protein
VSRWRQVSQWLDTMSRPDATRLEMLDRLNANLSSTTYLVGHAPTVADYLWYFFVHPTVVRPAAVLSVSCRARRCTARRNRRRACVWSGAPAQVRAREHPQLHSMVRAGAALLVACGCSVTRGAVVSRALVSVRMQVRPGAARQARADDAGRAGAGAHSQDRGRAAVPLAGVFIAFVRLALLAPQQFKKICRAA